MICHEGSEGDTLSGPCCIKESIRAFQTSAGRSSPLPPDNCLDLRFHRRNNSVINPGRLNYPSRLSLSLQFLDNSPVCRSTGNNSRSVFHFI